MAEVTPPEGISAKIKAQEISGQIAIGNNIVQLIVKAGAIVQRLPEQKVPIAKAEPISLLPPRFPGFLDRHDQTSRAVGTFVEVASSAHEPGGPVNIYGPPDIGKTSLLRHLAYHPLAARFPAGIVYKQVLRGEPLEDLLQFLFEAFYETVILSEPSDIQHSEPKLKSRLVLKPNETEIRHLLQHKQGLILLDDIEMSREECERLRGAARGCCFIMASRERFLWGEGQAIKLEGLPREDGVRLIESEIGRTLIPADRSAAEALCATLDGHPLRILQHAAMVIEEGRPLAEIASLAANADGKEQLPVFAALPGPERSVLAALAAVEGGPILSESIAAICELTDVESVLQRLTNRRLVGADVSRYSLTGNMAIRIAQTLDLTPWKERILQFLIERSEQQPERSRELLLEEASAVQLILNWAGSTGRWLEIQRLGRAIESTFMLNGRWERWREILQKMLQASQALKDEAGEGWALHQLGARAICIEEHSTAQNYLGRALQIRESLGDVIGASITRRNLDVLRATLQPPGQPQPSKTPTSTPILAKMTILSALTLLAGGTVWYAIKHLSRHSPAISLSSYSVSFGELEIGKSKSAAVTLSNHGSTRVVIRRIAITDNDAQSFKVENTCNEGSSILSGASCEIPVLFVPTTPGKYVGILEISIENANTPSRIKLEGTGIPLPPQQVGLPSVGLDRLQLAFEDQVVGTSSEPQKVKVKSNGEVVLTVDGIAILGDSVGIFKVTSDTCSRQSLKPGGECSVGVVFAPDSQKRVRARLVIRDNAPDSPQGIQLTGTGTSNQPINLAPDFTISTTEIGFGEQIIGAPGKPRPVTVTNLGPAPIKIAAWISRINGSISGDIRDSQIAIGKHITQTQITRKKIQVTKSDRAELRRILADLKSQVQEAAPIEKKEAALERVREFADAIVAKEPDMTTIRYVKQWFGKHLPVLAGAVTSVIVHPIVGRIVQAAGDGLAADFHKLIEPER